MANNLQIIQVYKDLHKVGRITNSGVERHNELVEIYRDKLRAAANGNGYKRASKIQLL